MGSVAVGSVQASVFNAIVSAPVALEVDIIRLVSKPAFAVLSLIIAKTWLGCVT